MSEGSVALRLTPWPIDKGVGRGWPGSQLLSLLVQRKLTKESTPRFAALRVPNLSGAVRAAAQLGLRPQTVLADFPRTAPKKLAAQRGLNGNFALSPGPSSAGGRGWREAPREGGVPSPQPEPRFRGEAGGSRRVCLSPKGELRSRPALPRNLGVSTDAGRPSFGYFSWPRKKSNALPGAPGQLRHNS
jgi:hypothetical protein